MSKSTADIDLDDINEHVARDDDAKRAGAAEERRAVVRWLKSDNGRRAVMASGLDMFELSRLIERGEHRR